MAKYNSLDDVPSDIRGKLDKIFTNVGGRTFAITGLPPELTGAALARYSRASTGMQLTIVNEFLDEEGFPSQQRGSELMDRVLNAFGDDSVGELEGVHVGIEDISQIGTKFIEDRRIGGSPIEQSTRYVIYDKKDSSGKWRYLRPKEISESGLLKEYESVNDKAFEVYSEGVKRLSKFFKRQVPRDSFKIEVRREGETIKASESSLVSEEERKAFNNAYNFTIRCAALDVGRCVLPSSTLTHLGVYGNGRFYTGLLNFMKSNELAESQERATELEEELKKVIPTFIKRNKANPKVAQINSAMKLLADELLGGKPTADKVTLVSDSSYLDQIASSALFPYAKISLQQIMHQLHARSQDKKINIIQTYAGLRESRRDRTGRGVWKQAIH